METKIYTLQEVEKMVKTANEITFTTCKSESPIILGHSVETLMSVIINPPLTIEEIKKQNKLK